MAKLALGQNSLRKMLILLELYKDTKLLQRWLHIMMYHQQLLEVSGMDEFGEKVEKIC